MNRRLLYFYMVGGAATSIGEGLQFELGERENSASEAHREKWGTIDSSPVRGTIGNFEVGKIHLHVPQACLLGKEANPA